MMDTYLPIRGFRFSVRFLVPMFCVGTTSLPLRCDLLAGTQSVRKSVTTQGVVARSEVGCCRGSRSEPMTHHTTITQMVRRRVALQPSTAPDNTRPLHRHSLTGPLPRVTRFAALADTDNADG